MGLLASYWTKVGSYLLTEMTRPGTSSESKLDNEYQSNDFINI